MQLQNFDYRRHFKRYRRYYDLQINPFIKSKHATAYTMVILSIFTISFFGMFAIRPTVKTIVELKRQIKDNKEVNDSLQKKIDSLVTAQEEYQLIRDFIPAINEALPGQPDITQALIKIESLASESQATIGGLQVQSIEFKPIEKENTKSSLLNAKPVSIDIIMKMSGSYSQVTTFLNKLFTMRRTVTAQTMELLPDTGQGTTLKLLLRLNTYYLK